MNGEVRMKMRKKLLQLAVLVRFKYIPLGLLLALMTGCVSGVKIESELADTTLSTAGGSVAQLSGDNQKGFIITENVKLDGAGRRDFAQAVLYLNDHNFDQAIELLENIIKNSPEVTAPYINLAMAYRMIGKPELAEEYLKIALTLIPEHPVASNEYGLLLRKEGRFSEARTVYEQALLRFPDYLPVRRNLGILCDIYLNDLECALTQYQLYSAVSPVNQQLKLWISELQLRLAQ